MKPKAPKIPKLRDNVIKSYRTTVISSLASMYFALQGIANIVMHKQSVDIAVGIVSILISITCIYFNVLSWKNIKFYINYSEVYMKLGRNYMMMSGDYSDDENDDESDIMSSYIDEFIDMSTKN